MKRRMATLTFALSAALLVLAPVAGVAQENEKDAPAQPRDKQYQLTLKIEGVECANCARAMASTLQNTPLKVRGAIKPDTTGPSQVAAACPTECDLGAVAARVNRAPTPHRSKVAPHLSLVLFADLDEESARSALAACRKIEGIDGKQCQADAKSDEIELRISGEEKVTVAQILTAMKEAGVDARTSSPPAKTSS